MACIGDTPALAKLVPGVNDLATLYPEVAKEADGWDPRAVSWGSNKKLKWRCDNGHNWETQVTNRTGSKRTGCPICSGHKVWPGFNDLATLYPEVAKEADGWDPRCVAGKAGSKFSWSCEKGHTWLATVAHRTVDKTGCPVCAGKQVESGFNDLVTLCPEVAKEANGWDPTQVSIGSNVKMPWKCMHGHTWEAVVNNRTPPRSGSCPICLGKQVLVGFNDLATLFPMVAKQADGWDPKTVPAKTNKPLSWRCLEGHTWKASPNARTPPKSTDCPVCGGRQVLAEFNDLATLFPELAKDANGWDPTGVRPGSGKKVSWKCQQGHTWETTVVSRTGLLKTGCPECAKFGFKPGHPAWFYLLHRPGEQQLGVTNEPEVRLNVHSRYGWQQLELVGPFPGDEVLALEKKLKLWLRKEVGLVPGTHENWFTASLEVRSLAELKARSGVETELF